MTPDTTSDRDTVFDQLEATVLAALDTYANVHRGSGHHSAVSTHLFERARSIVLEHLGVAASTHRLIFASPRSAEMLASRLPPGSYRVASSRDIGLPLGVRALAVRKGDLPKGSPPLPGGGTARLVAPGWVVWSDARTRFEAGTPAIVNVIAFAQALRLTRQHGTQAFAGAPAAERTVAEILRHDAFEHLAGRALLAELRKTVIGRGVLVPTVEAARPYVNLDNGASTPTFEPVWTAARAALRQPAPVRAAIVEAVRDIVSEVLGAPRSAYDVIFTANTTEAINLVAGSIRGQAPLVVNTLLEHNSNELPWRAVPGASIVRLATDAEGFVDLGELEARLGAGAANGDRGARPETIVAVTGASNVLGAYSDLPGIARVAERHGARLLVDGAQLVAHRAVAMERCGIDFLAFSAHKAYAPFGTGVLVARKGLLGLAPDETQRIASLGEENTVGIAALGKALVLLQRIGFDVIREEEQALTARTLAGLARIPGVRVYGVADPASPAFANKGAVIPFVVKGLLAHGVARRLAALGGIGVRSGCHCAHLGVKRVLGVPLWLERLQRVIVTVLPTVELPGVVRVSLGLGNTEEDVDVLLRALEEIARAPKGSAAEAAVARQVDESCEAAARRVYGCAGR